MYLVNSIAHTSYFAAIAAAKAIGADVIQADNGARRWTPAAPAKARKQHVLVQADGTTVALGKVRQ